ncbi:hypothetical protein [Corynebacterium suicordis]|uniref:Uncharacterized protein n=1 Tax=Corynebacterium suicordis DSM 45110 TaxID=1121369 RepID=A0ABR9ZLS7_9CORY|nr:hypothetical protein [Corynebacterium suicordis]MBF4554388.1 hypothetical protein [Corynebacterium suicordis DSM 45110]MDR6278588.1 hypothetical protein [Corynebacterium suicordis]
MDPLQQLDQELEQAFASVHRSGAQTMRDLRTRTAMGRGTRANPARSAARRTKVPGRRQLRRMTPGQLSGYMVSVNTRGMAGEKISTEARRISAELGRREMNKTQGQWNTMGNTWPQEAGFRQPVDTPERRPVAPAQTADVAAAREEAIAAQDAAINAQTEAHEARQEAESANARARQSTQVDTSPLDAAFTAVAAVGTVTAVDEVVDAVDGRASELGVSPIADSESDASADLVNDLVEDGADQELIDAADFGQSAVAGGDVAEALGAESSTQDKTMELGTDTSNEMPSVTPSPGQGAEI